VLSLSASIAVERLDHWRAVERLDGTLRHMDAMTAEQQHSGVISLANELLAVQRTSTAKLVLQGLLARADVTPAVSQQARRKLDIAKEKEAALRQGAYADLSSIWDEIFHPLENHQIVFVQVGTNCGALACAICGEPIYTAAMRHSWSGLVVEANPAVYKHLVANYRDNPAVRPRNVAVATKDGPITMHLPVDNELSELASAKSAHVKKYQGSSSPVREFVVPGVTLETLWSSNVSAIATQGAVHILNTDLEGFDHPALLATNFTALGRLRPWSILYEAIHVPEDMKQPLIAHLASHGYRFYRHVAAGIEQCGKDMDGLVLLTTCAAECPTGWSEGTFGHLLK